ncbi:MAG: OsmC family peroxiredoxin [Armatimonadota bacterium]|nr:OsmC family peroxiredoxin [Armatimonadota bacterium]MDR5696882.1 OsmC family peroxiredoxin [Armatimonadota bacterium]
MADIVRTANALWRGDLRGGTGSASTQSGAVRDVTITYPSRFEAAEGSNPEELVAAAHAACFSMSLAGRLAREGMSPEEIRTRAAVTLSKTETGFAITRIHLETEARVPGADAEKFRAAAEAAKDGCPISVLLRPGLQSLTLDARLVS